MTDPDRPAHASGLGWPSTAGWDPDGPGPLPAPDPTEVTPSPGVSRETHAGGWVPADARRAGLGWPEDDDPPAAADPTATDPTATDPTATDVDEG